MCTADSKFIRKMCTANSYNFVTHYEVKLLFWGYFLINELVQNMIGLMIRQTVCKDWAIYQIMEANAIGFLSNM